MASGTKATGLIADKGVEFLSFATANGYKVSWVLEELKEAYGLEVTTQAIDLYSNVQKEPWYLKISPNGKIPAIVDHDNGGLTLWQSSIIMFYLLSKYDTKHLLFYPRGSPEFFEFLLWLEFTSGDLSPVQERCLDFYRTLPERDAYAAQNELGKLERCYGVLNTRLEDRDYIAGEGRGKFTAVDIAVWCYNNYSALVGVGLDLSKWPNLQKHHDKIAADKKEIIAKAFNSPVAPIGTNDLMRFGYENDKGVRAQEDGLQEALADSRKKYGYVYRAV